MNLAKLLSAATFVLLFPQLCFAQAYPAKVVRIITGSPGSSVDLTSRVIATRLQDRLGQPVIVEARAGGATAVAAVVVAQSPPDGYTLLLFPNQITINPAVIKDLPYDPLKDFAAIGRVGYLLIGIAVNPSVPAASMAELLALAKAKPGALRYGTPGVASPHHLSMEYVIREKGMPITHIPYNQAPVVIADLVAGRIELGMSGLAPLLPMVQSGRIRMLAVLGSVRSPLMPEVPALKEFGVEGLESPWAGLWAPGNTSADIVTRLNRELNTVLAIPEVQEALLKLGTTVSPSSVQEFNAQMRSEVERWRKVVADAGIQQK